MKNKLWNIPSIIFNLLETFLILLVGWILNLNSKDIILIVVLFVSGRIFLKGAMHYKSWKKCLIWTLLLMTSLFILVKIDIYIAIYMTLFSAYIVTERANVKDGYMYYKDVRREGKYREMERFIEDNINSQEVKKFEDKLKKINTIYKDRYKKDFYCVYELKFKKGKSFEEIKQRTNISDNHELTKILDIIFMTFNMYMDDIGKLDKVSKKLANEER